MQFHILVAFVKLFHFVDVIRYARELPDALGQQPHAPLAQPCLVFDPALVTVDRRDGLEVPQLIMLRIESL